MTPSRLKRQVFLAFALFSLLSFFAFLSPAKTYAQISFLGTDLAVFPPVITIHASSQTTIDTPLTIQNLTQVPITLSVKFLPFIPSNQENGSIIIQKDQNVPFLSRLHILSEAIAIERITLAPKQQRQLHLTIDLANEDLISDEYFIIVFLSNSSTSSLPKDIPFRAYAKIASGIAIPVLLTKKTEDTSPKILVDTFSTDPFVQKGPVLFTIKTMNQDAHLVTVSGEITIRNLFGQIIGQVDLMPTLVLAHSSRLIPSINEANLADASSQSLRNFGGGAVWTESFLLGPYNASLNLLVDNKYPIQKSVYFFSFPLDLFLGLAAGIFIVVLLSKRIQTQMS